MSFLNMFKSRKSEEAETRDVFSQLKYSAEAEYREIVRRAALNQTAHATDVERLRALCAELGKTVHIALKEAEVLRQAIKLEPLANLKAERSEKSYRAGETLNRVSQEVQLEKARLDEVLGEAFGAHDAAQREYHQALEAWGALNNLKNEYPHLLSDPLPTPQEFEVKPPEAKGKKKRKGTEPKPSPQAPAQAAEPLKAEQPTAEPQALTAAQQNASGLAYPSLTKEGLQSPNGVTFARPLVTEWPTRTN